MLRNVNFFIFYLYFHVEEYDLCFSIYENNVACDHCLFDSILKKN
jgi:hypothetical protein